jgi:two-component system phosphate regulon sensor histidine kinase PhoR
MILGWFIAVISFAAAVVLWRRLRAAREELAAVRSASESGLAEVRRQNDAALLEHSQRQEALFNSMIEGVVVIDADGRVQIVNRAAEKLLGLSGSVTGRSVIEAFRRHEIADLVMRLKSEAQVLGIELVLNGGEPRHLQLNGVSLRDAAGQHDGCLLVCHDLSRLKQLENTRQDFVANVSHELRTPLSLIKGYVETLLDGAKDNPEVQTKFLRIIEKHADRLAFLIEDLLLLSKLDSGQVVLNLQTTELRPVIDQVLDDLHSRADEKKVSLQNEFPPVITARADGDRLQQVLFNLVDNAIKYGRPEGMVTVGGRTLDERLVEVWVHDDGTGIPAEARERVFERFYRVDKARSRDQGGTGLGLSIVKHIVQAHGGEVRVDSEVGQGTTFFFTLPWE